ncbi:MAG: hypothetical protein R2822_22500 [Spirosomataceae bacterium]
MVDYRKFSGGYARYFFVNDYVAVLENVSRTEAVEGVPLNPNDIAVKAQIKILDKHANILLHLPLLSTKSGWCCASQK